MESIRTRYRELLKKKGEMIRLHNAKAKEMRLYEFKRWQRTVFEPEFEKIVGEISEIENKMRRQTEFTLPDIKRIRRLRYPARCDTDLKKLQFLIALDHKIDNEFGEDIPDELNDVTLKIWNEIERIREELKR